jgi:hypothetical protein
MVWKWLAAILTAVILGNLVALWPGWDEQHVPFAVGFGTVDIGEVKTSGTAFSEHIIVSDLAICEDGEFPRLYFFHHGPSKRRCPIGPELSFAGGLYHGIVPSGDTVVRFETSVANGYAMPSGDVSGGRTPGIYKENLGFNKLVRLERDNFSGGQAYERTNLGFADLSGNSYGVLSGFRGVSGFVHGGTGMFGGGSGVFEGPPDQKNAENRKRHSGPCGIMHPAGRLSHALLGCEITPIRFGFLVAVGLVGFLIAGRGESIRGRLGAAYMLSGALICVVGTLIFAGYV